MMITHELTQGTPEWHSYRAKHFNASDAPAMMSCSPYKTRTQLLDELSRGFAADVGNATAKILDEGHRIEKLVRPLAEEFIGKKLYTQTGSNGKLSASFDGLTVSDDEGFEHKTLNDTIRKAFAEIETIAQEHREMGAGRCLPLVYRVQMEQQLAVCEGKRILFMASKWRNEALIEEHHCWYYPDPELRAQIMAGWKQFEEDLASHVLTSNKPIEKIVAEPVEALPTPHAKVSGELVVNDNFTLFEERLREFLADKLIRSPKTDEDFVNLGEQIKSMKQARVDLKSSKAQMFAQVAPIDRADKVIATLDKLLQENCSMAEKLYDGEKLRRKTEVISSGAAEFNAHMAALNQRLGKSYMPVIQADFAGVTSGLKSLASMEDKVAAELARAKIAANEIADLIQLNLNTLREIASQHAFLFADTAQLVLKPNDDLATLARARIAEHDAKEAARLYAVREKIRREEQERADREARERIAQQQRDEQRVRDEAAAADQQLRADAISADQEAQAGIAEARASEELPTPLLDDLSNLASDLRADVVSGVDARLAISTAQRTAATTPAVTSSIPVGTPTLKIGVINDRLQFFKTSEDGLTSLGITPAARERGNPLYHEAQFPAILAASIEHLRSLNEQYMDARAAA